MCNVIHVLTRSFRMRFTFPGHCVHELHRRRVNIFSYARVVATVVVCSVTAASASIKKSYLAPGEIVLNGEHVEVATPTFGCLYYSDMKEMDVVWLQEREVLQAFTKTHACTTIAVDNVAKHPGQKAIVVDEGFAPKFGTYFKVMLVTPGQPTLELWSRQGAWKALE